MKTSAIACAVLAGTLGFSGLASAAPGDHGPRGHRGDRVEQRHDHRNNHRADRGWNSHRAVQQPRYLHQQPRYSHAPRFQRGAYLPHQYRQGYYVNDWHAHRGLYAPPRGHQWVQVGSDFLLVAMATGLIANLLIQ